MPGVIRFHVLWVWVVIAKSGFLGSVLSFFPNFRRSSARLCTRQPSNPGREDTLEMPIGAGTHMSRQSTKPHSGWNPKCWPKVAKNGGQNRVFPVGGRNLQRWVGSEKYSENSFFSLKTGVKSHFHACLVERSPFPVCFASSKISTFRVTFGQNFCHVAPWARGLYQGGGKFRHVRVFNTYVFGFKRAKCPV